MSDVGNIFERISVVVCQICVYVKYVNQTALFVFGIWRKFVAHSCFETINYDDSRKDIYGRLLGAIVSHFLVFTCTFLRQGLSHSECWSVVIMHLLK